jgi:hypothetical protein
VLPCSCKPQQGAVHAQGVAARARGPRGRLCLSSRQCGYASSHERDDTNARSSRHASSRHLTLDTSRHSATVLRVKRLEDTRLRDKTLCNTRDKTPADTSRHSTPPCTHPVCLAPSLVACLMHHADRRFICSCRLCAPRAARQTGGCEGAGGDLPGTLAASSKAQHVAT